MRGCGRDDCETCGIDVKGNSMSEEEKAKYNAEAKAEGFMVSYGPLLNHRVRDQLARGIARLLREAYKLGQQSKK